MTGVLRRATAFTRRVDDGWDVTLECGHATVSPPEQVVGVGRDTALPCAACLAAANAAVGLPAPGAVLT